MVTTSQILSIFHRMIKILVTMSGNRTPPHIGDIDLSFTAQSTHGAIDFPKDYEVKYIVLFSHAADFTPTCTTESVAFDKRYEQFKHIGDVLVDFSID